MADRLFSSSVGLFSDTTDEILGVGGGSILGIGGGTTLSVEESPLTSVPELLVSRNLESVAGVAISVSLPALVSERSLYSITSPSTSTQASGNSTRQLNSVVNKLFTGVSDIEATRAFNSTASIALSTMSAVSNSNAFSSVAALVMSGQSASNVQRELSSATGASLSTISAITDSNAFSSSVAMSTTIEDTVLKYTIAGIKKLEYLTQPLVPDHMEYFYPKFVDFVRVFLRFLDYNSMFKTLNLYANNDLNKIFPEFIDYYVRQYLYGMVDLSKYELTDNNKQLFILLSRILNNSKGNKKAFSYLFRSLTDIRVANNDIQIAVDKIVTEFIENESWWDPGTIKYHDGTHLYDGSITYEAIIPRPFTYQFKIDQSRETMLPLIRSVHPAGFQQEFLISMDYSDEQRMTDRLLTTTTYYHFYSYGAASKTWYTHDGTINYAPSRQVIVNE